jgi:zinc protease
MYIVRNAALLLTVLFLGAQAFALQGPVTKTDKNGYVYETYDNDPTGLRIYTLKNGLKVYLSVNKNEPRIQTYIAVKAGSSYDPKETTGLAHYLEHMMFKGTPKFGTADWAKESELIQKISDLYELHKKTTDKEGKRKIYAQIDSISGVAAKYAIANEYDKLLAGIGAKGTNAFTSNEKTVYINDIPSNELEKWLTIEKERFNTLVLRLFHTELEAVYEEFNMSQDRDNSKIYKALFGGLFKVHPYGTQTTIGEAEHLKNPSMINIQNYWKTYYVPNNMAICMSGDLDLEKTIQLVDKTFGQFPTKPVAKINYPVEGPISSISEKEVFGPDAENLLFGYRFNGINTNDEKMVNLVSMILNNSVAGLIDLDLVQKQKIQRGGCYPYFLKNYGMHIMYGYPRQGQTLEQVKELLLAEIEKIKKGEFPDWLIPAIANDLRLRQIREFESNESRASSFMEAFTNEVPWGDYLTQIDAIEKVTKKQVIDFVKKNYKTNYVVVYKRKGKDENVVKVEKPKITPISVNRDLQSEFYTQIAKMTTNPLQPVFVDFKSEIGKKEVMKGLEFNYLKNSTNDLFELYYIIDMGKNHNVKIPMAVNYLKYLGTNKYTPEQLKEEMYKLGISLNVSSSDNRSYVYISGLGKSLEKAMELLEDIVNNAKPDAQIYKDYIDGVVKNRQNNKLNKLNILWGGLVNYAKYGQTSPFTNLLQEEELRNLKPEELTALIKDLFAYKHQVFYYGQKDQQAVADLISKSHKVPAELKDIAKPIVYPELPLNESKVFFTDYDMVQTNLVLISKDKQFDKELIPDLTVFNEYFGGSMSGVVFQDIRESKALAYSAYADYSIPARPAEAHYITGFVATQVDKLKIATDAMLDLMNKMPQSQISLDAAKDALVKKIESERITKTDIFWTYLNNKDLGIDYDIRKFTYEKAKSVQMVDLMKFYDKHVKGKNFSFALIGNRTNMDYNVLKQLGKVQELTLKDIFNY